MTQFQFVIRQIYHPWKQKFSGVVDNFRVKKWKSVRTTRLNESCQNTKSCFGSLKTWSVFALTWDKQEKQSPPNPLVPSFYAFEHNQGKVLPTSADILIAFDASCILLGSAWTCNGTDVPSRPRPSLLTLLIQSSPNFLNSMGPKVYRHPLYVYTFLHGG